MYGKRGIKSPFYGENNPIARKIICVETGIIFNSIADASRKYNVTISNIVRVCKGKGDGSSSGGYRWMYYEDYLNSEHINEKYKNGKSVICLNNHKIYTKISEAYNETGIAIQSIISCCKGRIKSAGRDKVLNNKLVWMYYEDYLKLHNETEEIEEIEDVVNI
jgi:hypothetical protein